MEENNTDGKRKIPPSIPANYISILQLQERWIKEKERKRKEVEEAEEEEERRREQHAEEQQRIEEDLKKAEEDLGENRANPSDRRHGGRKSKKNESIEKEETAAIRSERGEDAAPGDEGLPEKKRGRRKRYESKKKRTNLEVAPVKEVVVDECGSIAPPEYVVTEKSTPVKEAILVYRKKGEKATAIETQFEDLSIERGETKNLKAQTRSSNRNRHNQKHDLAHRRVRMPTETATMVWVKKGQKERADDGNGSGVKP